MQRVVATQTSTAKVRGAASRAAELTAVTPLLPIDIDDRQHCCLSSLVDVVAVYQHQHQEQHGVARSVTDCCST